MRKLLTACLSVAFSVITADTALGHGGQPYTGPAGSVPPNMRPPALPAPPPAPALLLSSATTAIPLGQAGGPACFWHSRSFEDWDFWWDYNSPAYLNLKECLFGPTGKAGDRGPFLLDRDSNTAGKYAKRPTRESIQKILPAVKKALRAKNADIRASACITLGRLGGAEEIPVLAALLTDRSRCVRDAVPIGIGSLQRKEGIELLLHLLHATEEACRLHGGRTPEWSVRALAAAGLALCGDNEKAAVREALKSCSADAAIHREIRVNATMGLGLLQGDGAYGADLLAHLRELASMSHDDHLVRAHAIIAIGRVLARNGLPPDLGIVEFLRCLLRQDLATPVRHSAVIALGTVFRGQGNAADAAAIQDLGSELASSTADPMTRRYAAIALGQIGGSAAGVFLKNAMHPEATEQLDAYAGLGLGILCRGLDRPDDETATRTRAEGLRCLRAAFETCRDPYIQGGLAIALGIARDGEAGPILLEAMKNSRIVDLRGYLAIAMGMINYTTATDDLRDVLLDADDPPLLKQQVAIGLGLLGNREVARLLVQQLRNSRNAYVATSIAKALGRVGNADTMPPLAAIMNDDRANAVTRAFAIDALGAIGDDHTLPVLANLFSDCNFVATTDMQSLLWRTMDP